MTVYIEYAVLDNFIIDWLLFRYTLLLVGVKGKKGRLFLCALFGTAFAVALPLSALPFWAELLLKMLSGLLLVLWLARYPSVKKYFAAVGVFLLLTFLTGGALTALFQLFPTIDTELCVGMILGGTWGIASGSYRALRFLYRRKEVYRYVLDCELTLKGKTVFARGFVDTGNRLYDGDRAVAICSARFALALTDDFTERKYIEVGTVNGREKILAFPIDRLLIYRGDKPNIYENITLGLTDRTDFDAYDVLLPSVVAGD